MTSYLPQIGTKNNFMIKVSSKCLKSKIGRFRAFGDAHVH